MVVFKSRHGIDSFCARSAIFVSWHNMYAPNSPASGSSAFLRRCWGKACVAALPVLSRKGKTFSHQRYETHWLPEKRHLGIGLLNSCLLDSCLSASCLSDSPPPSGRGSSGRGSLGRGSLGRGSSVVVVGARISEMAVAIPTEGMKLIGCQRKDTSASAS